MLPSMGCQRVGQNLATEQQYKKCFSRRGLFTKEPEPSHGDPLSARRKTISLSSTHVRPVHGLANLPACESVLHSVQRLGEEGSHGKILPLKTSPSIY